MIRFYSETTEIGSINGCNEGWFFPSVSLLLYPPVGPTSFNQLTVLVVSKDICDKISGQMEKNTKNNVVDDL
jgi:hypothetical protein